MEFRISSFRIRQQAERGVGCVDQGLPRERWGERQNPAVSRSFTKSAPALFERVRFIYAVVTLVCGHVQAESLHDVLIGDGYAIRLRDDAEVVLIVPHRPADIVLLKRYSHVV